MSPLQPRLRKTRFLSGLLIDKNVSKVSIPLVALDQGVADQDDAVAVLELEPRRLVGTDVQLREKHNSPTKHEKNTLTGRAPNIGRHSMDSGMVEQAGRWRWDHTTTLIVSQDSARVEPRS